MYRLREVEYKPIPVRELLVEMKNCSELMIDLAYSAILFNDKSLAEDVLELEEKIDYLRDVLLMQLMLAVNTAEDSEKGIGILDVAIATDEISNAAADMAYLVLKGISIHKSILKAVEASEEKIGKVELAKGSKLIGKCVGEVQSTFGIDIIGVRANKEWIINPRDDFVLKDKHTIIFRGSRTVIDRLKELALK